MVKYSTAQKKKCALACGLSLQTISKYVSEEGFDASSPAKFKKEWLEFKEGNSTAQPLDIDEAEAKKKLAIEKAHKMEVDRKRAQLELSVKEGQTIAIADEAQLYARLGLVIKSTLESLPRTTSIMLEGKTPKQIESVLEGKVREILTQLANIKK